VYKGLSVLGIVPARAGSKGIPNKNIKLLAGKPLIVYTVEAAQKSGVFDRLLVSTDGQEIARVARLAGADVPFLRPAELASDTAGMMAVICHTVEWLEERGVTYDCVVLLQPTSPLRTAEDIVAALELFVEREADVVVSVCEAEHHPWWCGTLAADGALTGFLLPEVPVVRQGLPRYYRLNGALYLARWEFAKSGNNWFGPRSYAYVMPRQRSVDIDDPVDFILAEALLLRGATGGENPASKQIGSRASWDRHK